MNTHPRYVGIFINKPTLQDREQFSISKKPCGIRATIKGKTMLAIGSIVLF